MLRILLFSLGLLIFMQALIADFEVSEGIYSKARIEDTDSVCLWLGANVMLEYSCEEVQPYILHAVGSFLFIWDTSISSLVSL